MNLIEANGFDRITIADIADAAEVAPRTLLRYFPTKEDVLVSWLRDRMSCLIDDLARRLGSEEPIAALSAAGRLMLSGYEEQAEFFLAIERVVSDHPSLSARKEQVIAQITNEVAQLLTSTQGFRPLAPVVASTAAGITMSMLRAAIRTWSVEKGNPSLQSLFNEASTTTQLYL